MIPADIYSCLEGDQRFRLLTLQPGKEGDILQVQLTEHRVADSPEYGALSYVWGPQTDPKPIFYKGRRVEVGANLFWALSRVRFADRPRLIWADAICINQNDFEERAQQVSIMDQIYRKAHVVLVCVGEPDSRSAYKDQDGAQCVESLVNSFTSLGAENRSGWREEERKRHGMDRYESLGFLLRLPWFTRTWVLQEVGLGSNIEMLYGSVVIDYRDLMTVLSEIHGRANPAASNGRSTLAIHRQWSDWSGDSSQFISSSASPSIAAAADDDEKRGPPTQSNQLDFLDLLGHASTLGCTDARDRIYALLGHPMARHGKVPISITPDYVKSPEELYFEVSKLLLPTSGLRLLSWVFHSKETLHDGKLPSWVPRWNSIAGNLVNTIWHDSTSFTASQGLKTSNSDGKTHTLCSAHDGDEKQNCLLVKGVFIDEITEVYDLNLDLDRYHMSIQGSFGGPRERSRDSQSAKSQGYNDDHEDDDDKHLHQALIEGPLFLLQRHLDHPRTPCAYAPPDQVLLRSSTTLDLGATLTAGYFQSGREQQPGAEAMFPRLWTRFRDWQGMDYRRQKMKEMQQQQEQQQQQKSVPATDATGNPLKKKEEGGGGGGGGESGKDEKRMEEKEGQQSGKNKEKEEDITRGMSQEAQTYWWALCSSGQGRRFALTSDGLYALVPRAAEPGDLCFVLEGGAVPFILRKRRRQEQQQKEGREGGLGEERGTAEGDKQQQNEFLLVGEAYVHGLMHGEAVMAIQKGRKMERLRIW